MKTAQVIARSKDELNKKLHDAVSNTLELPIKLQINFQHWLPTGWILKAQGEDIKPQAKANGNMINLFPIQFDKETKTKTFFLDYSCTPAQDCINQELEIFSSVRSTTKVLKLEATDRVSPIYLLHITRNDLTLHSKKSIDSWVCTSGFNEMNLLRQDAIFTSDLEQLNEDTKRTNFQSRIWEGRDDLQKAFKTISSPLFSKWIIDHGTKEHELLQGSNKFYPIQTPRTMSYNQRPFGVNLIGYASSVIGIGEDLRTCRDALESIGIPTATIDIPTKHTSNELREQARTKADRLAPYAFNLICMTAEEHARIFLEIGYAIFNERYNIGYWPWELGNWPEPWNHLFGLVDEVWASSRHIYQSIQKELNYRAQPKLSYCPLGISPIAPLTPEQKAKARSRNRLPHKAMLMICSFDGRSSFFRKNPWGAINAFLEAFPKDNGLDVGLVIKTIHAGVDSSEWNKLKELVKHDDRILVIDGALDRDELIQLYGCCDVLVSLHRAEGFGRILAECLLLGLNVVATNHSGNTDFCRGQHAHPVDYELTDVQDGDYPYHQNQQWAEPCCSHAAEILRNIYTKTSTEQYAKTPEGQATLRSYQKQLFIDSIAKHYVNQLKAIWNQSRHKTAEELNLRWSRQQCLYGMEES